MDFSDIIARVAEMLGLPDNDSNFSTKIKAWINESYKSISSMDLWPWLVKNDVVQTSVEIVAGTVDVTNASTAITFSSGPAVSVATDWRIQFSGDDNWYDITSHTAGATAAVLADNFLGTTDTVATYTLRKVYYSLPSDVDHIMSVRQSVNNIKLKAIDTRFFDMHFPDPTSVAGPKAYLIIGQDSSQNYRMVLHPTPSDEINVDIRYYQKVSDLSADADEPLIPSQFRPVLIFDVLSKYGYMFLDDTRINQAAGIRNSFLRDMKAAANPSPDNVTKKLPWDKAQLFTPRTNRLPFNFPIEE